MSTHFIVPTFNKSTPNKVHKDFTVTRQTTVSHSSGNSWASAIATESIPATIDGEYVFAVRIDNMGDYSHIMIGVTSMSTFDSTTEGRPGTNGMTGSALSLFSGNYNDKPFLVVNVDNLVDPKITKKAKEVIVVVTIANNGAQKLIHWIVNGSQSLDRDLTADCDGGKLFPLISMTRPNQQITTIPIDQITIRNDEVNKLFERCSKQTSTNQGAVANNNNQQQQQQQPSAAFTQLQQELEKERKRADLAESQVKQKDQIILQKDQQLEKERNRADSAESQLQIEKKNCAGLTTQMQQKDQLIAQLQQENKKLLQEISALKKDSDLGATMSLPAARCFDMALASLPDVKESLRRLLSLREVPPGRPDLQSHIPTDQNVTNILNVLDFHVNSIKKRDEVKKLITSCNLTDDNIRALFLYGAEHPYCVYRWLNGWLTGSRRDDKIKAAVGPFFNHLYRAMEKLPKIKSRGARAVKVNNIPSLVATYDNYVIRLAAGQNLSFWGVSSFSTNDAVINDPMFCGQPHEEEIIYMCGELVGVNMEPFKPDGMPCEDEILPLCPAVFEVQAAMKNDRKLIVSLKQTGHDLFSYVEPIVK